MSPNASISGFPEFSPAEKLIEDHFISTIAQVFELHGFAHLETRAIEPLSELERKGETSKEVYLLSRLQDKAGKDKKTLGLHFDLTVPLARYVLERSHDLAFPFRRYQIQKVWRGERPQEGRFREFVQADIDLIAQGQLPSHFEIEAPLIMAQALSKLPIPLTVIHVNSRKILQGICEGLGISADIAQVLNTIDKRDKVGTEVFLKLLGDIGLTAGQITVIEKLSSLCGSDKSIIEQVRALGVNNSLLSEGLDDVNHLLEAAQRQTPGRVVADFKIARGLDYYTGMVYETFIDGYESVGSVCSGGRYDNLVSDGKHIYPGVGMSIGVTRLLSIALTHGWVKVDRSVPTAVLVAVVSEEARKLSDDVAILLRERGICTEVSPNASKYGKQIKYAEKRGIPYVWFPDVSEVKDLRSGQQISVDPRNWSIPSQDLRPKVSSQ